MQPTGLPKFFLHVVCMCCYEIIKKYARSVSNIVSVNAGFCVHKWAAQNSLLAFRIKYLNSLHSQASLRSHIIHCVQKLSRIVLDWFLIEINIFYERSIKCKYLKFFIEDFDYGTPLIQFSKVWFVEICFNLFSKYKFY